MKKSSQIFILIICACILSYVADVLADHYIFLMYHNTGITNDIYHDIFSFDRPNELWGRFIVIFVLILIGIILTTYTRRLERSEHVLKQNEEMFKSLSEASFEAIHIHKEGVLINANDQYFQMFGYEPEELTGKQIIPILVAPESLDLINKQVRSNSLETYEAVGLRKDGSKFDMEIRIRNAKYMDADVRIGVIRDITDRKQAEEELRKNEIFIKAVLDNLPIGVAVNSVDPGVVFNYMNDNFPRFYSTTREALEDPDSFWDSVYEDPDFREKMKKRILADCASGDPEQMHWEEVPITRKGKDTAYINARNTPIPGEQLMISTVWDITKEKNAEESIKNSEELLNATQELTKVGGWEWDAEKSTMFWTKEVYRIHGFSINEIPEGSAEHIERSIKCYNPGDRPEILNSFQQCVEKGHPYDFEFPFTSADGRHKWVRTTAKPVIKNGQVIKVIGNIMDITERKEAEEKLRESEDKYKSLFNNAEVAIYRTKLDGSAFLDMNEKFLKIIGYTREELAGRATVLNWADPEERMEMVRRLKAEGRVQNYEFKLLNRDNEVRNCITSLKLYPDSGILEGSLLDITELRKTQDQIKASLREKEILLAEIHHRVKNNMQVISSLLGLQSSQLDDEKAREPFKTCENRIKSMALVHEKLYHSKDFASINFEEYLNQLVENIFISSSIKSNKIKSIINASGVSLSLDNAIPCGLIITELITNAMKHAFPNNKKGEIKIDLKKNKKGDHILTVNDNGIGIPENIDLINRKSLGFTLLDALIKQIKGEIKISGKKGTEVTITFPG